MKPLNFFLAVFITACLGAGGIYSIFAEFIQRDWALALTIFFLFSFGVAIFIGAIIKAGRSTDES